MPTRFIGAGATQDYYRPRKNLSETQPAEVRDLGRGGIVLSSPTPAHEDSPEMAQAKRLVERASQMYGAHTNKLPGHREAGMSSASWQRIVGLFGDRVVTKPGVGTFLVKESVFDLAVELEQGRVKFPHPTGAD